MATEAHIIVSDHIPPAPILSEDERRALASDPLVLEDAAEQERLWGVGGRSMGPEWHASYRATHPPRFVPQSSTPIEDTPSVVKSTSTTERPGGWYRTLTQSLSTTNPKSPPKSEKVISSYSPSVPASTSSSSTNLSIMQPNKPRKKAHAPRPKDWFIQRALPSLATSTPSPSSSLSDLLARAPPPLPSEAPFLPPVRTQLGPSNKGYALLSRGGWKEGEGLGVWRRGKGKDAIKVKREDQDDVSRVDSLGAALDHDVIDLTLDDEDEDDDLALEDDLVMSTLSNPSRSTANGQVLVAPLPTYLKPDRLGIGASLPTPSTAPSSKTRVSNSLITHYRTDPTRPTTTSHSTSSRSVLEKDNGNTTKSSRIRLTNTSQAMYLAPNHHERRAIKQRVNQLVQREQALRAKGGKKGRGTRVYDRVRKDEERDRSELLKYLKE